MAVGENGRSRKALLLVGGLVPFVVLALYLTEALVIILGGERFPTSVEAWYVLLQHGKILGLFYLNAPDILSISFLGLFFLALSDALSEPGDSVMKVGVFFAFLGIGVFVTTRSAMLAVLALSDRFAAAQTEAERAVLLGAGEAFSALGNPSPQSVGFFFMAIGAVFISLVMRRSRMFGAVAFWAGVLAGAFTVIDDLSLVVLPPVSGILMVVSGACWLAWWFRGGVGLLRLARTTPGSAAG